MATDTFLERLNENSPLEAPPINNACIPDIYNKMDADTIERTRAINSVLDFRFRVQEKVFMKYKIQAEKFCRQEKEKVYKELRKIHKKLPYMSEDPSQETREKIRQFRMAQNHVRTPIGYTTVPKDIPGLTCEKDNRPFCERYFSHHIPNKSKWFEDLRKNKSTRFSYGLSQSENYTQSRSKDKSRSFLISRGLSVSENCLVAGSKSVLQDDDSGFMRDFDDDAMTI